VCCLNFFTVRWLRSFTFFKNSKKGVIEISASLRPSLVASLLLTRLTTTLARSVVLGNGHIEKGAEVEYSWNIFAPKYFWDFFLLHDFRITKLKT